AWPSFDRGGHSMADFATTAKLERRSRRCLCLVHRAGDHASGISLDRALRRRPSGQHAVVGWFRPARVEQARSLARLDPAVRAGPADCAWRTPAGASAAGARL
ncbi:MAG: hypothetical protein AVDCRST_MAG62-539, partial [uncultured Sphingomonas sp.]